MHLWQCIHRLSVLVLVVGSLGGCASHTWSPGPGLTLADFEPAKAECSLMARNSGSSFVAYGNANYVAGASLGHAIGESVRAQANFNDCMSAKGWRMATPQTVAASKAKADSIKAVIAKSSECFKEVRSRETFAPIASYFPDPKTGKHSMTQLAVEQLPTPSEARLMANWADETAPCRTQRIAGVEAISPEMASAMQIAAREGEADTLLLIKRQLTWGAYGQHLDHSTDTMREKFKSVRF